MDEGFTTINLKEKRFNAEELVRANIPIEKILIAFTDVVRNISPEVFKSKGYTIEQLKNLGFTPCQLSNGFTEDDFKKEKFVYYPTKTCVKNENTPNVAKWVKLA